MPYADPEKRKEYQAKYRKENREKGLEYGRQYRENNREKLNNYRKTDIGFKNKTFASWRFYGLKDNVEDVWKIYQETDECLICDNKFKNSKDKHMNHCHQTGYFLGFLCHKCNILEHNDSYWTK